LFEGPNMSDDVRKEKIDVLPVTDIEINEASDGSGLAVTFYGDDAGTQIKIETLFFELELANRFADAIDAIWKVRKTQMGSP
jgi:hypothetical protein